MMKRDMEIFFEDRDLLVCEKPAGVSAQEDRSGGYDMVNRIRNHIAETGQASGKTVRFGVPPYVGVVHRLDRPVGGLMVFAKTERAAAELSRQIQNRQVVKRYLCVLTDNMSERVGGPALHMEDYLLVDGQTNLTQIVPAGSKGAKKAALDLRILKVCGAEEAAAYEFRKAAGYTGVLSLAEIDLLTGRHHQIRVQMAGHCRGIWGDTKYNPDFKEAEGWNQIALYAHHLEFIHPTKKEKMCFDRRLEDIDPGYPFICFT